MKIFIINVFASFFALVFSAVYFRLASGVGDFFRQIDLAGIVVGVLVCAVSTAGGLLSMRLCKWAVDRFDFEEALMLFAYVSSILVSVLLCLLIMWRISLLLTQT